MARKGLSAKEIAATEETLQKLIDLEEWRWNETLKEAIQIVRSAIAHLPLLEARRSLGRLEQKADKLIKKEGDTYPEMEKAVREFLAKFGSYVAIGTIEVTNDAPYHEFDAYLGFYVYETDQWDLTFGRNEEDNQFLVCLRKFIHEPEER